MSSTPDICCSMGVATDCSTVRASAPVYVVDTWISGGTMLGNWATGSPVMATMPTMTMRMAITIATIGRLMKNRAMPDLPLLALGGGGRRGGRRGRRRRGAFRSGLRRGDPDAGLDFLDPLDHDPLAGFHPVVEDPQGADPFSGHDRPELDGVVCAHHRDEEFPLHLRHRALRHQQRPLLRLQGRAHQGELT